MGEYDKLKELGHYLHQEIGNVVTVIYDHVTSSYSNCDRIKIKRGDLDVCSIYEKNNFLFDVIFYGPFICRSAGYSSIVCLTFGEVPNAIKNRINIHDDANDGRINVNVNNFTYADSKTAAEMVERDLDRICMYSARCNGKLWRAVNNYISDRFTIKDVIFNDPATIVLWNDGSKTVVKCQERETFDPEKGLAMAISKKIYGNRYDYYEVFNKYIGRYNKKRFNKALEEAKKIPPDEISYNGETYVLKKKE